MSVLLKGNKYELLLDKLTPLFWSQILLTKEMHRGLGGGGGGEGEKETAEELNLLI